MAQASSAAGVDRADRVDARLLREHPADLARVVAEHRLPLRKPRTGADPPPQDAP
ncbi:hypothetical protein ACFY00_25465 [Kitasatospora sp. NPDC001540]|uniref:hypothetical protein n=1 Tax=Kitasatospora sp. NPDC001540 TaxID=3364014 RepID=UPI0036BA95D8